VKARTLPLGVDIGATRVRVVEALMTAEGPRLRAVAVRDISAGASSSGSITDIAFVAALIDDAVAEIGTKERRCVASIGQPEAFLRTIHLPRMRSAERERCAVYEAQRYIDYPMEEAAVRIHPVPAGEGRWALGVARTAAINSRITALRAAKLKAVSIDHEACALGRALPDFDAVVDVGYQRTNVHVLTQETPATLQAFAGGADVTRGIERDLSIDHHTAEKRKRILGTAGAGERARAVLCADIAALIRSARELRPISRVAMVGNGARLPGLAVDVAAATDALVEIPVTAALRGGAYPDDVVRSSAPDWTLAAGLALWGHA
jgi:Tfp pilus assembly PilM family ATPase